MAGNLRAARCRSRHRCGPATRSRSPSAGSRNLADALLQQTERALERLLVARLVIAAAFVAAEAVSGLIDEGFHVGPLLLDNLDIRHRNRMIGLAEMQHRRNLRLLIGGLGDHAA